MSDIERKMASVQKIAEIKPIEGADRIVAYRINGWWAVDSKDKYEALYSARWIAGFHTN